MHMLGMFFARLSYMAYRPRYAIVCDGCSFHVTWQCHNHEWLLAEAWAKGAYYDLLLKYKDRYGVQIHSYHLMENHPHLTGTMEAKEAFSSFFRVVNNLFARIYNRRTNRKGQVVMDRFKSPRIQDDSHMLGVVTYGDMNGVRCGRDEKPEDAAWSSYSYYAYGKADPLITPAPSYLTLGATPEERQRVYCEMVMGLVHQEKINVSNVCFIGNPDWVKAQYDAMVATIKDLVAKRRAAAVNRASLGT